MSKKLQILEFSSCWNLKLNCMCYTTIRLTDKYKVGEEIEVHLNKQHIHNAIVLDKKKLKIEQINEFIARLDTGYSAKECQDLLRTMYKNYNVNWQIQYLNVYLLNSNLK